MLVAFDINGNLINAQKAFKEYVGYRCPCCGQDVFKAEGKVQKAHFRHYHNEKNDYCELYTEGLESQSRESDYLSTLKKPYLTFEKDGDEWDIFLTFPKISKKFAHTYDRNNISFSIKCKESNTSLHSSDLRFDSETNKIKVKPKYSYHFSTDDIAAIKKLELYYPMFINGMWRNIHIFNCFRNEYILNDKKEVSLNEKFYIVSKKPLYSHEEIVMIPLKYKYGWYAYQVNLPNEINKSIIDWFRNKIGLELRLPFYYLDLVQPSVYSKREQSFEIYEKSCRLSITFKKFTINNSLLVHVPPDMHVRKVNVVSNVVEFDNLIEGYHSFYIQGHEGKLLHLYVAKEDREVQPNLAEFYIKVNDIEMKFFEDKELKIDKVFSVQENESIPLLIKQDKKFPVKFSDFNSKLLGDRQIYHRGIWCFWLKGEQHEEIVDMDLYEMLKKYEHYEIQRKVWISNRDFHRLIEIINQNGSETRKLLFLIKKYRNLVPLYVKKWIEKYLGE